MSNPTTSYKDLFTEIRASIGSNPVAFTDSEILTRKAQHIDKTSILKAGDKHEKVLIDIDRFNDPIEHTIHQMSKTTSMHYVTNCKSVFTRTTSNLRILLFENQEWIVKNTDKNSISVSVFHINTTGDLIIRGTKTIPAGSQIHAHAI
jgi:hypothetical protein